MRLNKLPNILSIPIVIALTIGSGCKKFLDIPAPVTSINAENVYQSDNTAIAVITGLYTKMMLEFPVGGITSMSLLPELAADNLVLFDLNRLDYLTYYRNALDPNDVNTQIFGNGNYFSNFYPKIYTINAAIEGLNGTTSLTPAVKKRLLGEAHFLRAFYYFYLVNLFGDVPLVLSTDYTKNSIIPRSPTTAVYDQIAQDLNLSKSNLDQNYVDGTVVNTTTERVRPNIFATNTLIARVELYRKNYAAAESAATEVINATSQYSLSPLNQVFLKNSKETIWALQPVKTGYNTDEGSIFLMPNGPGTNLKIFYASSLLINSFENGDGRKTNWTNQVTINGTTYQYIAKYKADANSSAVTEYDIVLRLAEVYLIRAEARAQQSNITGALSDINAIRNRAGLAPITTGNTSTLMDAIFHERRVELFTEWGHRWLDLKRSNQIDQAMQLAEQYKRGTWSSSKALFPIPAKEILLNPNLTQNPGYN